MEKLKIIITGASGMLGTHLKEEFQEDYKLYCPDRSDINLVREDEVDYLVGSRPDVIIHAAAMVGGIVSNIESPYDYFESNILMNTFMVKAALKYKINRFIGILSTCAYPDIVKNYPMKEEDLLNGPPAISNFSYGYTKRCMAIQIEAANRQYGTKYNYVIPSNLYSEHDKFDDFKKLHFVSALIKKIKTAEKFGEKEITLFGDGTPLRQFMYAGDLAKIIKKVVDLNITESFNIAPENQNYTIDEMARICLEVLNKKDWKIIYLNNTILNGQHRKDVSIDKMKSLIGDFEFTKLGDGIIKVYDNYRIYNDYRDEL